MRTSVVHFQAIRSCATLALALGLAIPLAAQSTGGAYRLVTYTTILPGRAGDYQAAIKDYNAVLRKAGWDKRISVYVSASGPQEYRTVTGRAKLAELDTPMARDPRFKEYAADMARIQDRITACVERSYRIIDQVDPDLSLPLPKQPPAMVRVRRATVRIDKLDEFAAAVKNDLMPYVKQSGITSYTFARVRFGGATNDVYTTTGVSSWADLDDMPSYIKLMGDTKYKAYLAKMNSLITRSEVNVYRRMPDLSYDPAPTASTSN